MVKIICFDLDGTLLTDDKNILEENRNAIKRAKENGIEIVICTGRQNITAKTFNEIIGPNKYMICNNGAEIIDLQTGEDLFTCPIDKEITKSIYSWIAENENIVGFKFDTKYARYVNKRRSETDYRIEFDKNDDRFFDNNDILQMSVVFNNLEKREEFVERINLLNGIKVENKFSLMNEKTGEDDFYLNVINSSVSKGNSINGLVRYLKLNMDNVVFFGDGINELSMIQMAGHGIAKENANEILKENADEVIGDNNTDDISKVIDRIILENEQEKNN